MTETEGGLDRLDGCVYSATDCDVFGRRMGMKSLCIFGLEGAVRAGPAAAEFGGARPVGGEVSGCAGLPAGHAPGAGIGWAG